MNTEQSCENCIHNQVCASYIQICQILFRRNSPFSDNQWKTAKTDHVISALGKCCDAFKQK